MSTLLGSLPIRFTPSASCIASDNYWAIYTSLVDATTSREWGPWQIGPPITSDCLPPGYLPYSTAFYSPAQCPSGYTAAIEIVKTLAGSVVETTQTCCPTGHNFKAQPTSNTLFEAWPYLTTFLCTSVADHTEPASTVTRLSAGTSYETSYTWKSFDGTKGFNAYGVVVRFQSTDFQNPVTASSTSATPATTLSSLPITATTIPPQLTLSSPPPQATISTSSPSTGLNTSAKVGIGVGVGVGGFALLFALGMFLALRRRRMVDASQDPYYAAPPAELPAEPSVGEVTKRGRRVMVGDTDVRELEGKPVGSDQR